MASCDDDFSLLSDDQTTPPTHHHHHHHQHLYAAPTHRFSSAAISKPTHPHVADNAVSGGGGEDVVETEDEANYSTVNPFDESLVEVRSSSDKRKDRDEMSDYGNNHNNNNNNSSSIVKRSKSGTSEYRKDREEWSDAAIGCLLDAYLEKFTQLNRGNLRGRDWEEVAAIVSSRCEKQSKSVEQCKNKVDNLKKRYKLEKHRISNGGVSASHWPWFKKMEEIVGNSMMMNKSPPVEDDKAFGSPAAASSSATTTRQSKRFTTSTPSPCGQITSIKSKAAPNPKWQRVVFKISGIALAGTGPNHIDPKVTMQIAREVAIAYRLGIQVAIVVGSRNFFCGETWVTSTGSDRCTAYQVGLMASVMNSILLQSALEKMDVQTRVQTAFAMPEAAEPYSRQKAIRHLEKGRVVIFGGVGSGTGNPIFSTDTAAALRALDLHAEAVIKGTNVDGVYDCHSRDNNVTFEHITFRELASRGAASMDLTALNFCEDNGIPVVVFNLLQPGNISKALCGEQVGTLIDQNGRVC